MKIKMFLTVLLFSVVLSTSCEQKKSSTTKSAKKVTLKIHAWEGYVEEHIAEFKQHIKKTLNIELTVKITNTTGLNSFIKAIETQGVHLISPANDLLVPLKEKGLIRRIDINKISRFNQINPVFLEKRVHEIGGIPFATPFTYGPYAIAYNKSIVIPPKSYSSLWDPKYKQRVSISGSYDTANIYMTALMLGFFPKDIFDLNDSQLKQIEAKLKDLCENQIKEYWGDNINQEHHKDFDIGTDWGVGVNQINKKYGGNWGIAIPEEGVTAWVDSWVVSKNAKDTDILQVVYEFMDFMISPKTQAAVAKATSYAPVNPYSGRYLTAEEKKEYYLTDPKIFEKFILWQPLKPEVLKKYQQLWKRVKNAK